MQVAQVIVRFAQVPLKLLDLSAAPPPVLLDLQSLSVARTCLVALRQVVMQSGHVKTRQGQTAMVAGIFGMTAQVGMRTGEAVLNRRAA